MSQKKKPRIIRIAALIGAILLAGLYLSTLIFALLGDDIFQSFLWASLYASIAVPIIIYVINLTLKLFKNKHSKEQRDK